VKITRFWALLPLSALMNAVSIYFIDYQNVECFYITLQLIALEN
jgi:hypothetical protein